MLRHFDADTTTTPATVTKVVIEQSLTVTPKPSESVSFVARPVEQWSWSDLRDYVVREIEARFGTFPRDSKKEYGIFTRFHREHGADAGRIAKVAFEVHNGMWAGAPISINRFCKASDPYFAAPIKERLAEGAAQGW